MKKVYSLIGLALIGTASFAQQLDQYVTKASFDGNTKTIARAEKAAAIFEDDFSNPANWVITNLDSTLEETGWVIDNVGQPTQTQYVGNIQSTTADNGWAHATSLDQIIAGTYYPSINTALEFGSAIDLSAVAGPVTIVFEQRYRKFNGDLCYMELSTDDGATWVPFAVNEEAVGNGPTLSGVKSFNVPNEYKVANFKFRFRWEAGNRAPDYQFGGGYGWQIDDVALEETPDVSLAISSFWHGDIINDFEYTTLALEQAHVQTLGTIIANNGGADQNDVVVTFTVTKPDGTEEVLSSDPFTSVVGATDTITLSFGPADQVGIYTVDYFVGNGLEDFVPSDNEASRQFQVVDGVFSQGGTALGNASYGATNWADGSGGYKAIQPGSRLTIYNEGSQAHGISIALTTVTDPQEIFFDLYKYNTNPPDENDMEYLGGGFYTITQEDMDLFTTNGVNQRRFNLVYDDPIDLATGTYLFTFGTYGGPERLSFGSSGQDTDGGSLIFGDLGSGGETWYGLGSNPYLNVGLKSDWVEATYNSTEELSRVVSDVAVYPNPAGSELNISYRGTEVFTGKVTIKDLTGKAVAEQTLTTTAGVNTVTINTESLNDGIYFVSIEKGTETITKKVVVRH